MKKNSGLPCCKIKFLTGHGPVVLATQETEAGRLFEPTNSVSAQCIAILSLFKKGVCVCIFVCVPPCVCDSRQLNKIPDIPVSFLQFLENVTGRKEHKLFFFFCL